MDETESLVGLFSEVYNYSICSRWDFQDAGESEGNWSPLDNMMRYYQEHLSGDYMLAN